MDCLFNKYIPDPKSQQELIFKPEGKTFITGIAPGYNFIYNKQVLEPYIKEAQFSFLTNSLNEELYSHWPCTMCIAFGYVFSPCTLGLSFLCPWNCISTSKEIFLEKLAFYNQQYFNPKSIHLTYHQNCSTSWIKLEVNKSFSTPLETSFSVSTNDKSKRKEKELEFNTQTEVLLKSLDSNMRVELKK